MGNPNGRPRPHGWRTANTGYRVMFAPAHPLADSSGHIQEHVLIASEVLGKPLPDKVQVHHVNEDKTDNRKANLVVCQNRTYHNLLHLRLKALRSCGHVDWRQCAYCSQWDAPSELIQHGKRSVVHRRCVNEYQRGRYARRTGKV